MAVSFECWGDSHLDSFFGIGARNAIDYISNFNRDKVTHFGNHARAGSVVRDWSEECLGQESLADVVVVSSGFNEGVSIEMELMTFSDVVAEWTNLINGVKERGSKILWIPNQYRYGRAPEFPRLKELHSLSICLGADFLNWFPGRSDICQDRVHYTYAASYRLADLIVDEVASYKEDGDEATEAP